MDKQKIEARFEVKNETEEVAELYQLKKLIFILILVVVMSLKV